MLPLVTQASLLRQKIHHRIQGLGFERDWWLVPLAALIGAAAGLAAAGYGKMVHWSEEFFFAGGVVGSRAALRWWMFLLLPAAGALLVGLIKALFRLPRVSHGIPEVIEAMARRGGRLTLRSGFFTALNSALTLGSGGSTGQEGPIVHIGSVVGSKLGQWLRVSRSDMATLIGCGAAAGLAAIFNAPIAGVLLVLEVVLRDFSLRTFMPVVIASVFGVATSQAVLGRYGAVFALPPDVTYHFTLGEALPMVLLGVACAFVGVGFTRLLEWMEHAWEKLNWPNAIKPMLGGLLLGAMGLALVQAFPDATTDYKPPAFMGNGYRVIEAMLRPESYTHGIGGKATLGLAFLLCIAAGKIIGTGLTLGSGGSGGIFAPALFIGAAAGGATGLLIDAAGVFDHVSPALYALAGMAGVLAATVHCPLTAMILVFEITRDYTVILPAMLVAIIGTVISQAIRRESIYAMILHERGIRVGTTSDLTILRRIEVSQVPLTPAVLVYPEEPAVRLIELTEDFAVNDYVVCDDEDRYLGLVVGEDVRTALVRREAVPLMIVRDLMRADLPTVRREETLDLVLDKFSRYDVSSLAVVDDARQVHGMMTRARLMRRYHEALHEA